MVLGVVPVSSATAPTAWVGPLSKIELKLLPLSVLSHTPPDEAPTTIVPRLSAATELMRPVIATEFPKGWPVKLDFSRIGCGPMKVQNEAKPGNDCSAPLNSLVLADWPSEADSP